MELFKDVLGGGEDVTSALFGLGQIQDFPRVSWQRIRGAVGLAPLIILAHDILGRRSTRKGWLDASSQDDCCMVVVTGRSYL